MTGSRSEDFQWLCFTDDDTDGIDRMCGTENCDNSRGSLCCLYSRAK